MTEPTASRGGADGLEQPRHALEGARAPALRPAGSRRCAGVAAQACLHRGRGRSSAPTAVTPYAELHCHSHFSFLDGASSPADLVEEAVRLGLHALAITDHDGFYGAPMLAEAAAAYGLPTVFGAELSLGLSGPQNGVPDPEGSHLLVLARGVEGYHRLAAAMTDAHLRGDEKGRPVYDLDELGERGRGHWLVLTGCRKGAVRQALAAGGESAAAEALDRLTSLFGLDHVAGRALARVPVPTRPTPRWPASPPTTASPSSRPATSTTPPRSSPAGLGDGGRAGPAQPRRHGRLARPVGRGPPAQRRRDGRRARDVRPAPSPAASSLADELAFDLRKASPRCPSGTSPRGTPPTRGCGCWRSAASPSATPACPHEREARERIEHELRVVAEKDFAGYFVIVHDIVDFAREPGHPLPGPRLGGQLGGLLRPRHHRGRRRLLPAAVRAVHLRAPRRGARHRRRLRLRPARGGHPVGLRHLRPPQRRPGGQRHHLPAADGGPRRRQGAGLLAGAAGRLVQADRRVAVGRGRRPGRRGRPRRPRARGGARRGADGRAAPPRHPLRRDGPHRAADRRGLPDRARRGWTGAPCCSGTRTPASRWGW